MKIVELKLFSFFIVLAFFIAGSNFVHGQEKLIPGCILLQIQDSSSFQKNGIERIEEVLVRGEILYVFIPIKSNAHLPKTTVYYDSTCNIATQITYGGVVGIRKPKDEFTVSDIQNSTVLRVLWQEIKEDTHILPTGN